MLSGGRRYVSCYGLRYIFARMRIREHGTGHRYVLMVREDRYEIGSSNHPALRLLLDG